MPNHSLPYRPCGKCVLTLAGLTLKGTLDPQVARGAADCMTKKPQKPIFEPILAYPTKYPVGTAGSFARLMRAALRGTVHFSKRFARQSLPPRR